MIRPEKVPTIDLGVKTQWFDRLLTANLAVFSTKLDDFQANVVDSSASIYTRIKAYEIVNLRAGFQSDAGWEAFVSVRNAFDAKDIQNITVVSSNSGLVVGTPGDARALALRASY